MSLTETRGVIVHIYGKQRYGILTVESDNLMVYFRVERVLMGVNELEVADVPLNTMLEVNTDVVLVDCENILRINPRKNFASVEMHLVDVARRAGITKIHFHCVALDYSLFMGGLASSQLEPGPTPEVLDKNPVVEKVQVSTENVESTGKKRRRRNRTKSTASQQSVGESDASDSVKSFSSSPIPRGTPVEIIDPVKPTPTSSVSKKPIVVAPENSKGVKLQVDGNVDKDGNDIKNNSSTQSGLFKKLNDKILFEISNGKVYESQTNKASPEVEEIKQFQKTIPVISTGNSKPTGPSPVVKSNPIKEDNAPKPFQKVIPIISTGNSRATPTETHTSNYPIVMPKSQDSIKSSGRPLGIPVTPPPIIVVPPIGYTNLEGNIRSVHPTNTASHTVSFKYKKDVLIGAFFMQYVSINGSRIRSDELDKIRAMMRVGMPVFVIHFKLRNSSDKTIPYMTVVNFRKEILYSKDWHRKPVDGIVKPVAVKPVIKPIGKSTAWGSNVDSVWDLVDGKDIPTIQKSHYNFAGAADTKPLVSDNKLVKVPSSPVKVPSSPLKVASVANHQTMSSKAKEVPSISPPLLDLAPDGISVEGLVERYNTTTGYGVAAFRFNENRYWARFLLTEISYDGKVIDFEKHIDYVKIGMKVALLIRNSQQGAEFKYEGEGVITILKETHDTESYPKDKIFNGVVIETISNEGRDQPRIVSINMKGRKENVFISMRNVKVDDKRLGRSGLPPDFCYVGMKVKVSHLKVYSKSCKYEGIVEFQSSAFAGYDWEEPIVTVEDGLVVVSGRDMEQEDEKRDEKKLHFSLGWDVESIAVVTEVIMNNKGKSQPKIVMQKASGRPERIVIRSVTINGEPFEDSVHDFNFKVGVIIKVSNVTHSGSEYYGIVSLTSEEARLYDCLDSFDVIEQNDIIQWSIREEADRIAKEADELEFGCDASLEMSLEEDPVEEKIESALENLNIIGTITHVACSDNSYSGINTVSFTLNGDEVTAIVQKNRTSLNGRRLTPIEALEDFVVDGLKVTITKLDPVTDREYRFIATIDVSSENVEEYWKKISAASNVELLDEDNDCGEHNWSKEEMDEMRYAKSVADRIDSSGVFEKIQNSYQKEVDNGVEVKVQEADRVGFWKAVRNLEGSVVHQSKPSPCSKLDFGLDNWVDKPRVECGDELGFGYKDLYDYNTPNVDSVHDLIKLQDIRKLPLDSKSWGTEDELLKFQDMHKLTEDIWRVENDLGGEILTLSDEKGMKGAVGVIGEGDRKAAGKVTKVEKVMKMEGNMPTINKNGLDIPEHMGEELVMEVSGNVIEEVVLTPENICGIDKVETVGKMEDLETDMEKTVKEFLDTDKIVKEIKEEVLKVPLTSKDESQNLVLSKLDALFQRLSQMEERLESTLLQGGGETKEIKEAVKVEENKTEAVEVETIKTVAVEVVGNKTAAMAKSKVEEYEDWDKEIDYIDQQMNGIVLLKNGVVEGVLKDEKKDTKEIVKKVTCDQSTQTIVTGNIMFFKYNTDA